MPLENTNLPFCLPPSWLRLQAEEHFRGCPNSLVIYRCSLRNFEEDQRSSEEDVIFLNAENFGASQSHLDEGKQCPPPSRTTTSSPQSSVRTRRQNSGQSSGPQDALFSYRTGSASGTAKEHARTPTQEQSRRVVIMEEISSQCGALITPGPFKGHPNLLKRCSLWQ